MPSRKEDPEDLRAEYERVWSAQDRAWEQVRDVCRCEKPSRGPAYFREVRCLVCGKRILSQS